MTRHKNRQVTVIEASATDVDVRNSAFDESFFGPNSMSVNVASREDCDVRWYVDASPGHIVVEIHILRRYLGDSGRSLYNNDTL